jgi:hypothetical protein
MSDHTDTPNSRDAIASSADSSSYEARARAAFELGFSSRYYGTDALRNALLELADYVHGNIYSTLIQTINRMDQLWEELEDSQRAPIYSNDYFLQLLTLQQYADRAFRADSKYRKLYELGAFLGELLTAREGQSAPVNVGGLLALLKSFQKEQIDAVEVLKVATQTTPGNLGLEGFLRAVLETTGLTEVPAPSYTPTGSDIISFANAVLFDLRRGVAGANDRQESASPRLVIDETAMISGKIPPAYRTKPMSFRRAARLLGKGSSRDAAEWLSKSVQDKSYRCEHITRQNHVFDKRQFPKSIWPKLEPTDDNLP